MGRFDDRASQPTRGPADILKWKLGKKDPTDRALDGVRPDSGEGGAAALAARDCAVWIGHATWAFRMAGQVVVIDPIWSRSIGGAVKRLVPPGIPLEAMPKIDVVLVTHDHRDHMDLPTLARLPAEATYVVGVGNGARLGKPRRVVELDWWEETRVGELVITFVPARHWSMRMPWNRNATLWGGFVVQGPRATVYHSGDTAWGEHFAEIGQRHAITHAMLPIGGYAPRWFMEPQHIGPEEAGAAYEALGATHLLAMHWGTFRLTDEAVGEPVARLRAWWQARGLPAERLWIPPVGEAREL